MASLQTKFLGIPFENLFLIAAAPPSSTASKIIRAFDAGWGGVVIKTFGLEATDNVNPRIMVMRSGRRSIGLFDIELFSSHTFEWWLSQIEQVREVYPDKPLIASIAGSDNAHSWQEVIRRVEPLGVNAFELNLSCPSSDKRKGVKIGHDPELTYQVVKWVKEASHLPVVVKLTPTVTDVVALARVAMEAGADAFTASNSLTGIAGIDLDSFSPLPSVEGYGIIGGYNGAGLKPVSLRVVASVSQAINVPMMGVGGIERWQDAVEYMAVGAGLVQVCSAVMLNGFGMVDAMKRELLAYMDRKGFGSLDEIVGRSLPRLTVSSQLDYSAKKMAVVDFERCNGCALCYRACDSGGFEAIRMVNKLPVIDTNLCDGCGLCPSVCPSEAINLMARIMG